MNYHGGNIYDHQRPMLDFSSNINPLGVPDSFKIALTERMAEFAVYPDRSYRGVKQNIAAYLEVAAEWVVPGNGAVELIYQAIGALRKERVYTVAPTFSEYIRAARLHQFASQELAVFDPEYQKVDLRAVLSQVAAHSTLVICNPNNPTGTLIPRGKLCELAEELRNRDCALVVDEAFIEFTDHVAENTLLPMLENYENVIVIRAATKFFGMPGIRLGYAVTANQQLALAMQELAEPWHINAAAVIAADAIFSDRDYQQRSREWITQERIYFWEQFQRLTAFKAVPSQANFYLVQSLRPEWDAVRLHDWLAERGILIRKPEGFSGLQTTHFRLAVKDRTSNNQLFKTLKEV